MTKPFPLLPSISKRTRSSKIKQTSLLDYEMPKKQRRITAAARDTSDISAAAASATAASSLSCSSHSANGDKSCPSRAPVNDKPLRHEAMCTIAPDGRLEINRKAASERCQKVNAAAVTSASSDSTSTVAMKRQTNDDPSSPPPSNATKCDDSTKNISSGRANRHGRSKVFYDVVFATKKADTTAERSTKVQQQSKMESVTPSPDFVPKNDVTEKAITSRRGSRSSCSSVVAEKSGSTQGTKAGARDIIHCSTPPKGGRQRTKADCYDTISQKDDDVMDDENLGAIEPANLFLNSYAVPAESLGPLQTTRQMPTTVEGHDVLTRSNSYPHPPRLSRVPIFHQTWYQPYQPALSNGATSLPPGVIDIDAIPHACCLHAHHSHVGYSWISSRRRCGCAMDSNHNSVESMTEAYLGCYGVDRYGSLGLACLSVNDDARGTIVGGKLNETDWKAEQWWLDRTRKDMEAARTSISGSSSSASRSGLSLQHRSAPSRVCDSLLPSTVEKHVDYMQRQPHVTVGMRMILMDWLLEVTGEFKLSTETLWLSVTLVDRSLACSYGGEEVGKEMLVPQKKVQLVGW